MAWPCRLGQCRAHGGGCHVRVALPLSDVVDVCCISYVSYNYHQKQARTHLSLKITHLLTTFAKVRLSFMRRLSETGLVIDL